MHVLTSARTSERTRVLFVSQYSYPAPEEIRIDRLSASLSKCGCECWVACPGGTHESPADEARRVVRFLPSRSPWLAWLAKPAPWNVLWFGWLVLVSLRLRPRTIVLRNVRPAVEAVVCARIVGARLVADLSENYGALYSPPADRRATALSRLLRRASAWLETLSARHADSVMAVCEENAERLNRLRRGREAVAIVGNLPSSAEFKPRTSIRQGGPCRLVYLGLLDRFRAIDVVLHALAQSGDRDLYLEIIGDGSERARLEALARRLSVHERTRFHGRVARGRGLEMLRDADVGLIPHVDSDLTRYTLPNKLYDYFAAGMPVIATDTPPLRREIESAGAGFVVRNDPQAWADAFARLHDDPQLAEEMGRRGFEFGLRQRTWESRAQTLISVFRICA